MKLTPIIAISTSLILSGCGEKKTSTGGNNNNDGKPTIATVNYPLAYFAERLAGDWATITFDAPADEDPAFWEPSDQEVGRFQNADLILLNGASYAKWTSTTTLPFDSTVNTSDSFEADYIEVKEDVTHKHGEGDEHSHAGTAFTTWMDFKQAGAQASAVANAIIEDFPDKKDSVMKKPTRAAGRLEGTRRRNGCGHRQAEGRAPHRLAPGLSVLGTRLRTEGALSSVGT